eukprot:1040593-Rhodomonas_salina.3
MAATRMPRRAGGQWSSLAAGPGSFALTGTGGCQSLSERRPMDALCRCVGDSDRHGGGRGLRGI